VRSLFWCCWFVEGAIAVLGESVDILGDRFLIEIRGDRTFDIVGLLRGDRLCGGSMDILGDRFLIEI
jgi:hypothetical protein